MSRLWLCRDTCTREVEIGHCKSKVSPISQLPVGNLAEFLVVGTDMNSVTVINFLPGVATQRTAVAENLFLTRNSADIERLSFMSPASYIYRKRCSYFLINYMM